MEKNNKGLMILVAILSATILGLVGYIAYDKINENDEKENVVDNNKENNSSYIDAELSDYVFEKNADDGTVDLYINNKKVIFEDKGMNYAFNKVKKLNDDIFIVEKNLSSSSLYAVNADAKVIGVFTVGDSDYYKETPVLPTKAYYRDTYRIDGNSIYVQTDRFGNGGDDYTVCNTLTNDSDIVIYEEKFDYLGNDKFSAPVTTKTITRKQYMNEKNINCDKFNGNDKENNEVDNNEISGDLQAYYSKFSGKYGIGKTEVDEDFCNSDRVGKTETGYIFFEIKNDGTAIYRTGDYCAGGMSVSGKYIIDYDKIYIIDDICNFECYEGNCHIPNCTRVISVNYKEKNGKIVIYEEHNGQITELERR